MIIDSETNFVYFSSLLKDQFHDETERILKILNENNIQHSFLEGTSDIWVRDYTPIQVEEDTFIQFNFNPSYLNENEKYKKLISNTDEVCRINNLNHIKHPLKLEGGNLVRSKNKVILTDRIVEENESTGYTRTVIINELEKLFNAEIILIPAHKDDFTGHADGMVRFYDENTLLVNDLSMEYLYWRKEFLEVINAHNLNIIEIPCRYDKKNKESAIGIYINYLQVGNFILLPEFGLDIDSKALNQFRKLFPDHTIETININAIAKKGGVLNCISWNVRA
jgi:agmatine deiminase